MLTDYEQVAIEARASLAAGIAIDYGSLIRNKQYQEITWSVCGLPETNEVVVIATVGALEVGIRLSRFDDPQPADRIHLMDDGDRQQAVLLAGLLMSALREPLVTEAMRVRRQRWVG